MSYSLLTVILVLNMNDMMDMKELKNRDDASAKQKFRGELAVRENQILNSVNVNWCKTYLKPFFRSLQCALAIHPRGLVWKF